MAIKGIVRREQLFRSDSEPEAEAAEPAAKRKASTVYLATSDHSNFYKVGRSAMEPAQQRKRYQTYMPNPFLLIIPVRDGVAAEADLMKRLSPQHITGEMFEKNAVVLSTFLETAKAWV